VDEAERDGPGQAEDVAAAELGELGRDGAALEQLLELRAERVEDDRQDRAPQQQARGDDQEPQAIRPPRVGQQGAVYADVPAAAPAGASTGS
jgi:hypothetical protein